MRTLRLAIPLAMAVVGLAQEGVVGGPTLGLLYDASARSLHRVNGVPAAALMGERLGSADGLDWLEAAPGGAFAFGRSAETGLLELVTANGHTALEGLPAGARGVKFSPAGRAALLLLEERAVVLTALAETPVAGWEFAISGDAQVAVSDDGGAALSLAEGRLVWHGADGSVVELLSAGVRAAVFAEGRQEALVLTEEAGVLVTGADGSITRVALPEGFDHPLALAGTSEYLLAATEDGRVTRVSRDGSTVETISCGCKPASLTRMARSGLYRLNEAGEGPVWLLDAGEAQPRVLFIPPVVKEAE